MTPVASRHRWFLLLNVLGPPQTRTLMPHERLSSPTPSLPAAIREMTTMQEQTDLDKTENGQLESSSARDATVCVADHLVWSMEHTAWWAPDECGYTKRVEAAGRYTKARAEEIAAAADPFPRREKAIPVDGRHQRVELVNALVVAIAGCGRRFFRHGMRTSHMEIDGRGRLWWNDKHSGHRIYTGYPGRWRHFTEGGTLRHLVECLRTFVKTGEQLPRGIFGPWAQWVCDGDLWGYGAENMETIRTAARRLGMLATDSLAGDSVLAVDPATRSGADSWSTPTQSALAPIGTPPEDTTPHE